MFNLIKTLLWIFQFSKKMSILEEKIHKLTKLKEKSDSELKYHKLQFDKIKERYLKQSKEAKFALDAAEVVNKKMNNELIAIDAELTVIKENTIPAFTQSHEVVMSTLKAQNQILQMKSVMHDRSIEEDVG